MAENTYTIARDKGAEVYEFTYDNADIAETFHFVAGNWQPSLANNVTVANQITPMFDSAGVSQAGAWLVSASTPDIPTVAAVQVRWIAQGVTVSYSLNGTTWTAIQNGAVIDLAGVTAPDLDFQVSFPGGIQDDTASLTQLNIYVFATEKLKSSAGIRGLTFDRVSLSETVGHQLNPLPDEGAVIPSGGYIQIEPDARAAGDIINVNAVEFWFKKTSTENSMLLDASTERVRINNNLITLASCTAIVDGVSVVSGTTTVSLNQWHFMQVVFTTPNNRLIRFAKSLTNTDPGSYAIFGLAAYPNIPTNTYAANVGNLTVRVDDPATLTVSQPTPGVDIYAYDWAIVTATR